MAPRQMLNEHLLCACPARTWTAPCCLDWPLASPLPIPQGLPPNANPAVSCPSLKPVTGCWVHTLLTWPAWSPAMLLVPEPRSSPVGLLRPPRSACTWALPELPEAGFLWAVNPLPCRLGPAVVTAGLSAPRRAEGTSTVALVA